MELKCERCGHEWIPRQGKKPMTCPKCRSSVWEKPLDPYWKRLRDIYKERREENGR